MTKERYETSCLICGKKFYVVHSRLDKFGRGKYCSRECFYKSNIGKSKSIETKAKMSIKATGKNNVMFGRYRQLNPTWKGGKSLTIKRMNARRRTFGHIFLNEPFEGSEGHHIDRNHVIFVPKELHRSIKHTLNNKEIMDRINERVFVWLLTGRMVI